MQNIKLKSFIRSVTDNKQNIIIFCESYTSLGLVIPILNILSKNKKTVELIVSNNDLFKFFMDFYDGYFINIINLNQQSSKSRIDYIFFIILEKYRLRTFKKAIINERDSSILFFSKDFSTRAYHLIKHLKKSSSNKIYYTQIGILGYVEPAVTFKNKIQLFLIRSIYGKNLNLVKRENNISVRINDYFFESIETLHTNLNEIKATFGAKRTILIPPHIKVIIFDQPWPSAIIDDVKKANILKVIMSTLKQGQKIGVKYHPGQSNKEFSECFEISPSYIPAELLDINENHIIISFASYVLSETFVNAAPAISLINFMDFEKESLKSDYLAKLVSVNKKLIIPNTYDELLIILNELL